MQTWTAHNIEMRDGSRTMPGRPLLEDTEEFKALLRTAQILAPVGSGDPPRVVDLGCLEGGYSVGFARAGYEVVGIEGREANVGACRIVEEDLGLANLEFVQADARDVESFGRFDLALVLGILYHLDRPVQFLQTLGRVVGRAVLIHTHYARSDTAGPYKLGPMEENERKRGRWFSESKEGSTESLKDDRWAALDNTRSFWLERQTLLQTIRDAGFAGVYEQYDFQENIEHGEFIDREHRSLFVGVKSPT